jgi:hypothetical protein
MIARDHGINKTGWDVRHNGALGVALGASMAIPKAQETAVAQMLRAWETYAAAHNARFESAIGEDYVLGPAWEQIGLGIRALLNGELGRLDGGTLDRFILDTLKENGSNTDHL